jgi:hypothetical protein
MGENVQKTSPMSKSNNHDKLTTKPTKKALKSENEGQKYPFSFFFTLQNLPLLSQIIALNFLCILQKESGQTVKNYPSYA